MISPTEAVVKSSYFLLTVSPSIANSTPTNIQRPSSSRTEKWAPSTSNAPTSTASGITPSVPTTAQIERLIP